MSEDLHFPWEAPPPTGAVTEIAPGLLWARLPLPFRLDHVNVWLLEEDDGWTVVDTGCRTPTILAAWEALLAGPMGGRPVRRVVATHGHVDHIGLTGWLVDRFDAEFVGTFAEWVWARLTHLEGVPGAEHAHDSYLRRNGVPAPLAAELMAGRNKFIDLAVPLPGSITEVRDGGTVELGGRTWQAIVTRGHAFEHLSLYDAERRILIAGDHLLPKISPVIAVYELIPQGDPLGDFLASFGRFDGIAGDALVLPSHGLPYRGIHERIAALRAHHGERLQAVSGLLREPKTAYQLAAELFPRVRGAEQTGFALAEAVAHLNYLLAKGDLASVSESGAGATVFQTVP